MKLQSVGKLLIGIGIVVIIYALIMPVSVGSSGLVNIHLLNERQNTLIIGGLLFIAGIILFATFKIKETKEEADDASERLVKLKIDQNERIERTGESIRVYLKQFWPEVIAAWKDHGFARLLSWGFAISSFFLALDHAISYDYLSDYFGYATLLVATVASGILAFKCTARKAIFQVNTLNITLHAALLLLGVLSFIYFLFVTLVCALLTLYAHRKLLTLYAHRKLGDIPKLNNYRRLKIIFSISAITIVVLIVVMLLHNSDPVPESLPERLGALASPISTT